MTVFADENSILRRGHMLLGDSRAKRSQDENPLTHQGLARTVSVDHAPWSHLSLHGRRGTRLSATRPQLARVNLPPSIPAQPFGLGWRFDRTPSGSARSPSRQTFQTNPRRRTVANTYPHPVQGGTA